MSTIVGWGVQPWGTSPWGGSIVADQPSQPIGDFDRFQRVHRESRFKHEPEIIRNVLFKIDGVRALAHVGRPVCSSGRGTAARAGTARLLQSGLGAVAIQTGTGTWATAQAARSICQCGRAEAGVSLVCEIEGVASAADVGLPKVRAVRNPTDEELLMMIAEMI